MCQAINLNDFVNDVLELESDWNEIERAVYVSTEKIENELLDRRRKQIVITGSVIERGLTAGAIDDNYHMEEALSYLHNDVPTMKRNITERDAVVFLSIVQNLMDQLYTPGKSEKNLSREDGDNSSESF